MASRSPLVWRVTWVVGQMVLDQQAALNPPTLAPHRKWCCSMVVIWCFSQRMVSRGVAARRRVLSLAPHLHHCKVYVYIYIQRRYPLSTGGAGYYVINDTMLNYMILYYSLLQVVPQLRDPPDT